MVIEKKETYTYTSPTGVVFVITNVPSLVYETEEGVREVRLTPESSRSVNKYIRKGLELYHEPNVYSTSFEEVEQGSSIDLQFKFEGENISLNKSSLNAWHTILQRIKRGYDSIRKIYEEVKGVRNIKPPVLVPGSGSLIIGLRGVSEFTPPLFRDIDGFEEKPINDEIQIFQLLIDGYDFIDESRTENDLLLSYPEVRLGVVKAIEILAPKPSDAFHKVGILPKSELLVYKKEITFTPETRLKATSMRKILEVDSEDNFRDIILVGQIEKVSRKGVMTIKNIEYNYPEFKNYPTRALFPDNLWKSVVSFFEEKNSRLVFEGVEFKINNRWSNQPIIKSVKEAPSREVVQEAFKDKRKINETIKNLNETIFSNID